MRDLKMYFLGNKCWPSLLRNLLTANKGSDILYKTIHGAVEINFNLASRTASNWPMICSSEYGRFSFTKNFRKLWLKGLSGEELVPFDTSFIRCSFLAKIHNDDVSSWIAWN